MTQVFWKEIAEAYAAGNMHRVRKLYSQISQGLFFFSGVCSCFLMPFSRDILLILLGPEYQAAWLPLTLMLFYPIHQSLGQISGIVLLAIEKTKTKSCIGIFFMGLSIIVSYFIIAPKNLLIPGLNMGAIGLALKMVLCLLVEVNLTIYFVAKYLEIPFKYLFQFNVLFFLLPLSFFIKYFSQWILSCVLISPHFILVMIFSSVLYLSAVIAVVYRIPSIAGMNREHIDYGLAWIRKRLNFAE